MTVWPIQSGAIHPPVIPFAPVPQKMGKPDEIEKQRSAAAIRIRKRIAKEFGIEVLDTDVRFAAAEVMAIEETLKEIRRKKESHLIGVRRIVKNRKGRIKLIASADLHAYGAYDPDHKTIFLFDNVTPEKVPEVVTHEIGHAVHYFNMEFQKFMEFVATCGYNMVEFRKFFIPGNKFYQIGAAPRQIPLAQWGALLNRFSMTSLSKNADVFGEIILQKGSSRRSGSSPPWEANPLAQVTQMPL